MYFWVKDKQHLIVYFWVKDKQHIIVYFTWKTYEKTYAFCVLEEKDVFDFPLESVSIVSL